MHSILIIVLSAVGTAFLLTAGLAIESWEWRHGIKFYRVVPGWSKVVWGKVLSIILGLAILGTLGTLGYVLANPAADSFTEFYIMGLSGKAADYPGKLMAEEEGKVIMGIINREHEPVTYRVEVVIDGVKNNEIGFMSG